LLRANGFFIFHNTTAKRLKIANVYLHLLVHRTYAKNENEISEEFALDRVQLINY